MKKTAPNGGKPVPWPGMRWAQAGAFRSRCCRKSSVISLTVVAPSGRLSAPKGDDPREPQGEGPPAYARSTVECEFAPPSAHPAANTLPRNRALGDCAISIRESHLDGLTMGGCQSDWRRQRLLESKIEYGGRGIRTPEGLHPSCFQAPTAIRRLLLNTKPDPEGHFLSGDFTTGSAPPAERCTDRSVFSRRPMSTVARTSKERKRKSSGPKTACVFSTNRSEMSPNIMMMMRKSDLR